MAIGKNESHDFCVYEVENNDTARNLLWTEKTTSNVIFSIGWNPLKEEFCLCGIKTILFCVLDNRQIIRPKINNITKQYYDYTAVNYCPDGVCITSTTDGVLIFWNFYEPIREVTICSGAIQTMNYCSFNDTIYTGDNTGCIILLNRITFQKTKIIQFASLVKSIAINDNNGDFLVGLKNGKIT